MSELLNCPFCDAKEEEIALCFEGEVNADITWFVRCYACHVETARHETGDGAKAVWNSRSSPLLPQQGGGTADVCTDCDGKGSSVVYEGTDPESGPYVETEGCEVCKGTGKFTIADQLHQYAGNSGYSHQDYADTMTNAADEIERLRAAVLPQVGEAKPERQELSEAANRRLIAMDEPPVIGGHVMGQWFEVHTIDEMQQFYMSRLPAIREAAKACGYAIGLHGSTRRDFDLMAMQWTDEAVTPDELAHAIAKAACGITRDGPYEWEKKPQGRIATSFTICWTDHSENFPKDMLSLGHIDLSIIAAPATLGEAKAVATFTGLSGYDGIIKWHKPYNDTVPIPINVGDKLYAAPVAQALPVGVETESIAKHIEELKCEQEFNISKYMQVVHSPISYQKYRDGWMRRAELAHAAGKDAERYRWLRKSDNGACVLMPDPPSDMSVPHTDELDRAIDAAIALLKGQP